MHQFVINDWKLAIKQQKSAQERKQLPRLLISHNGSLFIAGNRMQGQNKGLFTKIVQTKSGSKSVIKIIKKHFYGFVISNSGKNCAS